MILFQAAVAQKKAIGHSDKAVVIPGYSFVSILNYRVGRKVSMFIFAIFLSTANQLS